MVPSLPLTQGMAATQLSEIPLGTHRRRMGRDRDVFVREDVFRASLSLSLWSWSIPIFSWQLYFLLGHYTTTVVFLRILILVHFAVHS